MIHAMSIERQLHRQKFANGYALVDGVLMHEQNGSRFQIPHQVLKNHVGVGHFVEVRVNSDRFSAHPDAPEKCMCSSCNGEATQPILSHEQPASLVPSSDQNVPSRGWGEDFWVHVIQREGEHFRGIVDNSLYESRLHKLNYGDEIVFHANHVLGVHPSHRQDMLMDMDEIELKQLIEWLGTL